MNALAGWENFYVIVGSSAGALIGLQFVVITLFADRPAVSGQGLASGAYATPTIVHFAVVLLLSASLSAPWHGITGAAILCGLLGLGGLAYAIIVGRRQWVQKIYQPVFEDWLFHALLPIAAYATLTASACAARRHAPQAMFAVAAAAMLLLLIGIHNAWDAVTYHVFVKRHEREDAEESR